LIDKGYEQTVRYVEDCGKDCANRNAMKTTLFYYHLAITERNMKTGLRSSHFRNIEKNICEESENATKNCPL